MNGITFIYVLNDPRDGRIRYVGKSDNPYVRWMQHINSAGTDDHRGAWIRSLLAVGLKPELEILEKIPMAGWQEIEKEYIRVFRMVNMNLVNSTDGGDGGLNPSRETRAKISASLFGNKRLLGHKHSPEARSKMSAVQKGKDVSPETRAKLRVAGLGRTASPETRAKLREANLGKKLSPEHRAKLSAAGFGRVASPETRAKISAVHLGKTVSPGMRAKLRAANLGKVVSPETRAKLRAANLGKVMSPEACAKTRAANLGRKHSPEARANMSAGRRAYLQKKKEAILICEP